MKSSKNPKKVTFNDDVTVKTVPKKMTQQDINERVLQIMSGGKLYILLK